jgi:hypothetical protein
MKAAAVPCALLLTACATSDTASNEPLARCESTDCFNQLQIRNYEIIDGQTLIVYVGSQECPFRVDLTGTFCDVTFLAGEVVFRPSAQRSLRDPDSVPGLPTRADVFDSRVCANDFSMGLEEGPFTEAGGAGVPDPSGLDCRIQDVTSLTDDELVELYVSRQIAPPPPPLGSGTLEVEESGEGEADTQVEGEVQGETRVPESTTEGSAPSD